MVFVSYILLRVVMGLTFFNICANANPIHVSPESAPPKPFISGVLRNPVSILRPSLTICSNDCSPTHSSPLPARTLVSGTSLPRSCVIVNTSVLYSPARKTQHSVRGVLLVARISQDHATSPALISCQQFGDFDYPPLYAIPRNHDPGRSPLHLGSLSPSPSLSPIIDLTFLDLPPVIPTPFPPVIPTPLPPVIPTPLPPALPRPSHTFSPPPLSPHSTSSSQIQTTATTPGPSMGPIPDSLPSSKQSGVMGMKSFLQTNSATKQSTVPAPSMVSQMASTSTYSSSIDPMTTAPSLTSSLSMALSMSPTSGFTSTSMSPMPGSTSTSSATSAASLHKAKDIRTIIGLVIGAVTIVCLTLVILLFFIRRRRKLHETLQENNAMEARTHLSSFGRIFGSVHTAAVNATPFQLPSNSRASRSFMQLKEKPDQFPDTSLSQPGNRDASFHEQLVQHPLDPPLGSESSQKTLIGGVDELIHVADNSFSQGTAHSSLTAMDAQSTRNTLKTE